MRIRLTVKRHNLPEAAVVWVVDTTQDPTISQLLEQVNEILPLESEGDWGLEDYAVEVKGAAASFECLHFQNVKAVLREDDEVWIRPLLTQDLRQRRVSGRHQITFDGRHLYDGFVFGRPKPRGPADRPLVAIPPRKRRRIAYDNGSDEHQDDSLKVLEEAPIAGLLEQDMSSALLLAADLDDEDDEDDEDFNPELAFADSDEDDEDIISHIGSDELLDDEDKENTGQGAQSSLGKLQDAFPDVPVSICERILVSCSGDFDRAWEALQAGFPPTKAKAAGQNVEPLPKSKKSKVSKSNSTKEKSGGNTVNDTDDRSAQLSPSPEENSFVSHYDQHGLAPGSIVAGKGLSQMAKIATISDKSRLKRKRSPPEARSEVVLPSKSKEKTLAVARGLVEGSDKKVTRSSREAHGARDLIEQETSSESSSEDSSSSEEESSVEESSVEDSSDEESSEEDSSDEESSDEADSSSDDDSSSSARSVTSGSASDASVSDSDAESAPEESSSKNVAKKAVTKSAPKVETIKPAPISATVQKQSLITPGTGRMATKSRNQRRRIANQMRKFREKGLLPVGITRDEFLQLQLGDSSTAEEVSKALEALRSSASETHIDTAPPSSNAAVDELNARRERLLATISKGGVEINSSGKTVTDTPLSATSQKKVSKQLPGANATPTSDGVIHTTPSAAEKSAEPSQRRTKLDLGAGRRLLFGALGLRTPKTKADEDKIREDLMKLARPLKSASLEVQVGAKSHEGTERPENPEAWRDKINLRAVECCYDGIELSEPPFPFVQRWDPQQRADYYHKGKRGGKGKKNQRNQTQYYDEAQQRPTKRQKHSLEFSYGNIEDESMAEVAANLEQDEYNIRNNTFENADLQANGELMNDRHHASSLLVDDLPALPPDLSTHQDLKLDNVKLGMVIAFKQLEVSETTNWQPQLSAYRTAVVTANDNGNLEVALAHRDRPEKYYDEETGERVYGRFEMPDDEDQDDGKVNVDLGTLVEAKIIRAPSQSPPGSEQRVIAGDKHDVENQNAESTPTLSAHHEMSPQGSDANSSKGRLIEPYKPFNNTNGSPPTESNIQPDAPQLDVTEVSKEARENIATMMREAGFRSSVSSSIVRPHPPFPNGDAKPESIDWDQDVSETANDQMFSSEAAKTESQPPYVAMSPSRSRHDYLKNSQSISSNSQSQNFTSVEYPKLSVPPSIASYVSDHGHQPEDLLVGDDTLQAIEDLEDFSNEQQLPGIVIDQPSLPSSSSMPSSDSIFPPLDDVFSSAQESSRMARGRIELQPLSDVVEHQESYDRAMADLDARFDEEDSKPEDAQLHNSSQLIKRGSRSRESSQKSSIGSHARTTNANGSQSKSKSSTGQYESAATSFQPPLGSQQVDLTVSSDVEAIPVSRPGLDDTSGVDSNDESFGLPKGPGWVQKRRPRRRRTAGGATTSSKADPPPAQTEKSKRKTSARF